MQLDVFVNRFNKLATAYGLQFEMLRPSSLFKSKPGLPLGAPYYALENSAKIQSPINLAKNISMILEVEGGCVMAATLIAAKEKRGEIEILRALASLIESISGLGQPDRNAMLEGVGLFGDRPLGKCVHKGWACHCSAKDMIMFWIYKNAR